MTRDMMLFLYGLTFVAEALLWLYHKLHPNPRPVFA